MRRFLFLALLLVCILFVLDPIKKQISNHALPWLPAAIGIGLGLFLIHNLIDFAIFDPSPGPLMLFALLIGGLIGIRSVQTTLAKFAWASFGLWLAIALMCIGVFVAPVLLADSDATQADEQFRENHCDQAAVLFESAQRLIPYNAEYPFRKAEALIYAQAPLNEVDAALNQAIAENPRFIDAYLLRARYFQRQAGQYKSAIVAAYENATALNPNDVGIRLEFAEFLKDSSEPQKAVEQYQKALWYNDQFPPEEAKRLSPEDVEKIQQNITGLK
jgi:tetratricopeptide (TPR) repeat protein